MPQAVQVATTSMIEGWAVREYLGLVTAHVVAGTGLFSDIAAGFSDLFGGRSGTYQKQLAALQEEVVEALKQKARRIGANWVLGTRIDFDEVSGKNMQMFMVSASGTAVIADPVKGGAGDVAVSRAIAAGELHAGLARMALVEQAETGRLQLNNDTWLALADLKVVEAVPAIIDTLRTLTGTFDFETIRGRALDFFRALPVDALQHQLHGIVERVPEVRAIAFRFVTELGLVDLHWVRDHLASGDFELRRAALQLLRADAPSYTAADLALLQSVLDSLPAAFPENVKLVEKKGILARKPEQRWLCRCGEDNDLHKVSCVNCGTDRRGLGRDDFKPEDAIARLGRQLAFLRDALSDG